MQTKILSFISDDTRIKSGMSVTANIIVEEKKGVLTVPSGTVKSEGKDDNLKFFVMRRNFQVRLTPTLSDGEGVVQNSATSTLLNEIGSSGTKFMKGNRVKNDVMASTDAGIKTFVNVGMNNDIDTEILEDVNNSENNLKEGDEVVSKAVDPSTAVAKTQTAFSLFGPPRQGVNAGGNNTGSRSR